MNNKAYESGYLEGKSEGFEQGVSYGANRMFETIFTAYQEKGLSLKKLKKIQKEFFDSLEASNGDENIADFTMADEVEEFND